MALFFQDTIDIFDSNFQTDKSDDKKFFANAKARGRMITHAATSIPTAALTISFPLNAESVDFKGIIIDKSIHMIDSTGIITMSNVDKMPVPIPNVNFHVLVGLGDQQNNANILTLRDFNAQNKLFVPAILNAPVNHFQLPAINEKFYLSGNQTFLNIFFFMMTEDIGDITNYITDFNTCYAGALVFGAFLFDISVFIAGKTSLKK
jgi:hypothetical protein